MKKLKKQLIKSVIDFNNYALLTKKLFSDNFDFVGSPFKATTKFKGTIPMKGKLNSEEVSVEYSFHGLGCKFIFNKKDVVDFNYTPPNWDYLGFTIHKFQQFIQVGTPEFRDIKLLEYYLEELEKEGILINIGTPYSLYKIPKT